MRYHAHYGANKADKFSVALRGRDWVASVLGIKEFRARAGVYRLTCRGRTIMVNSRGRRGWYAYPGFCMGAQQHVGEDYAVVVLVDDAAVIPQGWLTRAEVAERREHNRPQHGSEVWFIPKERLNPWETFPLLPA